MSEQELDPVRDPVRWETLVGRVMAESRPELARLRQEASPAQAIARWWRGLTVGAGLLAAAAALVLVVAAPRTDETGDVPVVAAALSSEAVAAWLIADEMPTAEELLAAYEGGER